MKSGGQGEKGNLGCLPRSVKERCSNPSQKAKGLVHTRKKGMGAHGVVVQPTGKESGPAWTTRDERNNRILAKKGGQVKQKPTILLRAGGSGFGGVQKDTKNKIRFL